jgi:hypothetical protein
MKRKIIKEELDKESWQYFTVKGHFQSIHLRRKYSQRTIFIKKAQSIMNKKNRDDYEDNISSRQDSDRERYLLVS